MSRILLLTGNHLCHNPRVLKEADALAEAGFVVEVLGAWLDPELAERDRRILKERSWVYTPVVDLTQSGTVAGSQRKRLRIRTKLGRMLGQWLKIENPWQLGYCARELYSVARLRRCDLAIAHSEQGLWAAEQLHRRGSRVGVDMEDWFSEDLLPEARRQRPVKLLRSLEEEVLQKGAHGTCPSLAMAAALQSEFHCSKPVPVYNAFAWRDRESLDGLSRDRLNRRSLSLHWYSQTLGPGRGLEDLFRALPWVKSELEIHLRGKLPKNGEAWIRGLIPDSWQKRVNLHDLVSNEELLARISEHDIGFAGEMSYCRSRDLTVTNKILQYLLGGLAVVASDTAGQREVSDAAGAAVMLYPGGDARELARVLDQLLVSPDTLRLAKSAALKVAERQFCWEQCSGALVESVRVAMRG